MTLAALEQVTPDMDSRPTGAWLDGDPIGDRQFRHVGPIELECGRSLDTTFAFETWGTLNADASNAVLVLHALTGDSHAVGPASSAHPSPGWWNSLIGPGKTIDTNRYFVVAPNVLGGCQGTTGPASLRTDGTHYGSHFPPITVRDQVRAEHELMAALGIDRWDLVIGGSMGGMRALEWGIEYAPLVDKLVVIASAATTSADVVAWNHAQLYAIESSPAYRGGDFYGEPGPGPGPALGIARRIAHTTYRTATELEARFAPSEHNRSGSRDARFEVESYLDHHAEKLAKRFDAAAYVVLTRAMNSHDVGRGRGGVNAALASVTARTLIVGIDTDRLFPPQKSRELANGIPTAIGMVIDSPSGHDAFLMDHPDLRAGIGALLCEDA